MVAAWWMVAWPLNGPYLVIPSAFPHGPARGARGTSIWRESFAWPLNGPYRGDRGWMEDGEGAGGSRREQEGVGGRLEEVGGGHGFCVHHQAWIRSRGRRDPVQDDLQQYF